ncbi:hypothetical protein VTI74DRAFT_5503 [Chaetomium olivicolor]
MADIPPPLLPNKPQEIAGRHVARYRGDTQNRALLFLSPTAASLPLPIPHVWDGPTQRTGLITLSIEVHDPPARLRILRLERDIPRLGGLSHPTQARPQARRGRSLDRLFPRRHRTRLPRITIIPSLLLIFLSQIPALHPHPSKPPIPHRRFRTKSRLHPRRRRPLFGPLQGAVLPLAQPHDVSATSFVILSIVIVLSVDDDVLGAVCPPPLRPAINHPRVTSRGRGRPSPSVATGFATTTRPRGPPWLLLFATRVGREVVENARAGGGNPDIVSAARVTPPVGCGRRRIGRCVQLELEVIIVRRHSRRAFWSSLCLLTEGWSELQARRCCGVMTKLMNVGWQRSLKSGSGRQ